MSGSGGVARGLAFIPHAIYVRCLGRLFQESKKGGRLAILPLPVSTFFWIRFVPPIWILPEPMRLALVLRGRRAPR